MQSGHYHQIVDALDRALGVFAHAAGRLSADDYQMKREIELLRTKIVKAESRGLSSTAPTPVSPAPGQIAPAPGPVAPTAAAIDPQLTKAPWTKL